MGLLAALKAIGAQLLGFKFLFTIFQERTRAYYLHQGLTLGSAQYIATGRGYTMSSNFVKLFSWYARSHFYCGIELLFMTLNYYAFTSSGGRHFTAAFSFAPLLANTWPVLLVALSMWFSPWIFNPHSFQATAIVAHWYEFRQWIDGEAESGEPSGWKAWHSAHWRPQRSTLRPRRKVPLYL